MKKAHSILLLFMIFLSACGTRSTTMPVTETRQRSDLPQATFIPGLTQTLTMSSTPTPTPMLYEWEAARTATAEAKATEAVEYHIGCNPQKMIQTLTSPDKTWLATSCDYTKDVFIVSNRDGSKSWSVPAGQVTGRGPGEPDFLYCGSTPVKWANDSRYVYFFLYFCMAADAVSDYASSMNPNSHHVLYRMDIQTGDYVEFTPLFNDFYFSPTGRYLLCITRYTYGSDLENASIKLTFIDLKKDETMHFWLEDTLAVANVIWGDDDKRIFFVAEKGIPWFIYTQSNPQNHFTIYEYNIASGGLIFHLELLDIEGVVYPTAYNETDNTLSLTQTLHESTIPEMLTLDLSTHQLVTPMNAPTP